jgi:hypothetical protein
MMGLGWADIERMSLWEYEARLYHWNEAHGGGDISPPDAATAMRILEKANLDPRLTQGPNRKKRKAA